MMDLNVIAKKVDAGEAVSRAEAEALVRAVARRCRGKAVVAPEFQRLYFDGLLEQDADDLFERFVSAVSAPLARYAQDRLLARNWDHFQALVDALRAHAADLGTPCGFDFNDEVLRYPFDGAEHDYTCPQCGAQGSFRSPLIPLAG